MRGRSVGELGRQEEERDSHLGPGDCDSELTEEVWPFAGGSQSHWRFMVRQLK